jgi:hypothetical protein
MLDVMTAILALSFRAGFEEFIPKRVASSFAILRKTQMKVRILKD